MYVYTHNHGHKSTTFEFSVAEFEWRFDNGLIRFEIISIEKVETFYIAKYFAYLNGELVLGISALRITTIIK